MKIACIIHSLDGGGAERVMAGLASRLAQRGHQTTLITLDDGRSDRHDVDPSVLRRPLQVMAQSNHPIDKFLNTRHRLTAIRRAVADANPDVVLSFCDRTNILVLMALGRTAIPTVIAERSDPRQQHLGRMWEVLRKRTYHRADRIVALTQTSAEALGPLSQHPVVVIPSAVETPPQLSDRTEAETNQRILAIGRLEPEKGFDRLMRAFQSVAQTSPSWNLRILGEGSQRDQLLSLAEVLGIDDQLSMPGWVRPVWDELSAATIFALPSRHEGFPSALLEAMAAGVPSVAVDCESGPRSIVRHEIDGLLVENSVEGLAGGIARLIDDTALREKLGRQGKSVTQRFNWEKMTDAYQQVLREAVTSR